MSITNNKTNKSKERATTCPISGNPKPRRYAVAKSVWEKATAAQKEEWASNAAAYGRAKRPTPDKKDYFGSLRRMRVGR